MSHKNVELILFEHVLEKSECENIEKNFEKIKILSGWINNRVNFFDVITMPLGKVVLNLSFYIFNFLAWVSLKIIKNP